MMKIISILLITLFSIGCAGGSYNVRVESLGNSEDYGKRYVLFSANDLVSGVNSLDSRRYTGYLHTALQRKGFVNVGSDEDGKTAADILILMTYNISDPMTSRSGIIVPDNSNRMSTDHITGTIISDGSINTFTGTATYIPTSGSSGYTTIPTTSTDYKRIVIISAADIRRPGQPEVWRTEIVSTGRSGDLRKTVPILIAAAVPYIGKDTNGRKSVSIGEDDGTVAWVKASNYKKPTDYKKASNYKKPTDSKNDEIELTQDSDNNSPQECNYPDWVISDWAKEQWFNNICN
jgi:hypothetical protein